MLLDLLLDIPSPLGCFLFLCCWFSVVDLTSNSPSFVGMASKCKEDHDEISKVKEVLKDKFDYSKSKKTDRQKEKEVFEECSSC